MGYRVNGYKD
jgi:hypothetical protein